MIDRVPPQNMDAEQSVLGSMLLSKDAILEVRNSLSGQDFYRDSHGLLFEAMCKIQDSGTPVDLVTIGHELQKLNLLDKVGGVAYVASLAGIVPTAANAEYYARIIKEKSFARKLIRAGNEIIAKAYGDYENIEDVIRLAEKSVFELSLANKTQEGLVDVYELTHEVVDEILLRKPDQGVIGIPTGFKMLDYWTAGFQPGQLIVIAARPSMGKTSWAVQLGVQAAIKHKRSVAIFSLETSRKKIIEKMLINQGLIDGQNIRFGKLTDEDEKKLIRTAAHVAQSGVMIDDSPGITANEILSRCRKAKLEKGLDLVVIDYLQRVTASSGKNATRDREIGDMTREFKKMSMELNVPVIVLSQLTREVERLADKRPSLSHLRESGSIEADADTVIFLYRPEYYFPDTDKKGITEMIIAKQREGSVGTIEVAFIKQFTRFTDLAREIG